MLHPLQCPHSKNQDFKVQPENINQYSSKVLIKDSLREPLIFRLLRIDLKNKNYKNTKII